jgi:hypothetical protein
MRTQNAVLMFGALLLTLAATPAVRAHHAFAAEFDANKPIKLDKAVVTKVDWVNPHTWIHVDVARPDGTKERWSIEAGTPNVLFRRGFNKLAPAGHRHQRGWLPCERWISQSQRPRPDAAEWPDAVPWFLGHGGAERPIRSGRKDSLRSAVYSLRSR